MYSCNGRNNNTLGPDYNEHPLQLKKYSAWNSHQWYKLFWQFSYKEQLRVKGLESFYSLYGGPSAMASSSVEKKPLPVWHKIPPLPLNFNINKKKVLSHLNFHFGRKEFFSKNKRTHIFYKPSWGTDYLWKSANANVPPARWPPLVVSTSGGKG